LISFLFYYIHSRYFLQRNQTYPLEKQNRERGRSIINILF